MLVRAVRAARQSAALASLVATRETRRREDVAWTRRRCPVDVRRVLPGFPPTYFGCAVALAGATVEAAMARSLATIEAVRERLGTDGLERLHVVHPRAGLLVTNLSRLPAREVVFDVGPPVASDILVPAERCAVVHPAEDGLDVRVCAPLDAAEPAPRDAGLVATGETPPAGAVPATRP